MPHSPRRFPLIVLALSGVLLAAGLHAPAQPGLHLRALPGLGLAALEEHPALPRVLIIGDSISVGYTEPVQELLEGEAIVLRIPVNAQHSGYGLAHLEEWLGEASWDVIHFNHGLHDLKYVKPDGSNAPSPNEGELQVPLEQYRENMTRIVERLKETGAALIFATTTPVPEGVTGVARDPESPPRYNAAALEIMQEHGVQVNDLYNFTLPRLEELQRPQNVHFSDEGSEALAKEVARQIRKALAARGD